eukprot:TRINITY_DN403_c0_g1_i11.p1 TRINITY_DN403_c0_g1~~TRINITY_DN403_c0_g1_i11.p1  ORF type:complete len:758 (-),score=252.94 TRINITY_DN403_c0_g1_i11:2427-4700(-)
MHTKNTFPAFLLAKRVTSSPPDGTSNVVIHSRSIPTNTSNSLSLLSPFPSLPSPSFRLIKVWRDGQLVETLRGHENTITCVLALPGGDIVSSSGDRSVKVWRKGQCIATIKEHDDTIQGLFLVPGLGFMSCGNDGKMNLMAFQSFEILQTIFDPRASIAYKGTVIQDTNEVALACEDRSVKIFQDGECVQVIDHPHVVFDVQQLPNGDLVSVAEDRIVRVWTRDPKRTADPEALASYMKTTQEALDKLKSNSEGGEEMFDGKPVSSYPGEEALQVPGKVDGAPLFVNVNGQLMLFTWSASDSEWKLGGQLVNAEGKPIGSSKPQQQPQRFLSQGKGGIIDGVQYEYVWDIDVETGGSYKLGYNHGMDIEETAANFVYQHGLSEAFITDIAESIRTKVGMDGFQKPLGNPDPFTGGNRYVPGAGGNTTANVAGEGSPFTAGRYHPKGFQQQQQQSSSTSNTTTTTTATETSLYTHFPKKQFVLFDQANDDKFWPKIISNNAALAEGGEAEANLALEQFELDAIQRILTTAKDTSRYHSSEYTASDMEVLLERLLNWPLPKVFPVIDLLRLVVLHPNASEHLDMNPHVAVRLAGMAGSVGAEGPAPIWILVYRFLSNMYVRKPLKEVMDANFSDVFGEVLEGSSHAKKGVRMAFAVFVQNASIRLANTGDNDSKLEVMVAIQEMLGNEQEADIVFRLLVALGTLIVGDSDAMANVVELEILEAVQQAAETFKSDKQVKECADEIAKACAAGSKFQEMMN